MSHAGDFEIGTELTRVHIAMGLAERTFGLEEIDGKTAFDDQLRLGGNFEIDASTFD